MKPRNATRTSRPFTRSCRKWLLLALPDNVTKILFDTLSTNDATILSAVNQQLRTFALAHKPASWVDISITLKCADHVHSLIVFLTKLGTTAKSLTLFTNALDINYLQLFPVMTNIYLLNLSRNPWLKCDHLELLATRMPSVTQLRINDCDGLDDNDILPTDRLLEIIHRKYAPQLTVFNCVLTTPRQSRLDEAPYNYWGNMMVRLISGLSNVTTFNMSQNAVVCPNAVIAGMLSRSPTLRELRYMFICTDVETQTFMSALSSCRNLTTLSLVFIDHPCIPTVPLKPWMFRTVFSGLTILKNLVLNLDSASVEDEAAANGNYPNPPFLDHLTIGSRPILHPFLYSLITSQIGSLKILIQWINGPDLIELFPGLLARQLPHLRQLYIRYVDYSSALFTPPEAGYRHILNRTPALVELVVKTENKAPNDEDTELLEALTRAYPNCEIDIDNHKLSAERRRAIAAQSQSLQE